MASTGRQAILILPWLDWGGADRFHLNVAAGLHAGGWQVTLVLTEGCRRLWLPYVGASARVLELDKGDDLSAQQQLLAGVIEKQASAAVLVSSTRTGYALLPFLRAHYAGMTLVDYCHMEEMWGGGGFARLSLENAHLIDRTLVTSAHLRQWMVERGGDAGRIHVVPAGIDTEVWRPDEQARGRVRGDLGIGEETPLILYAGRVTEQKQPCVLAHTILRLHGAGLRFALAVAGEGVDLPWLRAFVAARGLDHVVHLLGLVPPHHMPALTAAADIAFLPSRYEGIAVTLYEAMACGLPVLSAAVGGQAELVTPQCGFLIEPSRMQAEVDRYTELLAQLVQQPDLRRRLGQAGRCRVEESFRFGQSLAALSRLLAERPPRRAAPGDSGALQPAPPVPPAPRREAAVAGRTPLPSVLRRWMPSPVKRFVIACARSLVWGASTCPRLSPLCARLSAATSLALREELRERLLATDSPYRARSKTPARR